MGSGTRARIAEVIGELPMPPTGIALDFGCGSGALTKVIREALQGLKLYGTDLSSVAVEDARERVPGCVFMHPQAPEL